MNDSKNKRILSPNVKCQKYLTRYTFFFAECNPKSKHRVSFNPPQLPRRLPRSRRNTDCWLQATDGLRKGPSQRSQQKENVDGGDTCENVGNRTAPRHSEARQGRGRTAARDVNLPSFLVPLPPFLSNFSSGCASFQCCSPSAFPLHVLLPQMLMLTCSAVT